ncbi:ATP-binding protein [Candidatus Thiomargarita nelsonii]|uniref:ATP-binding protein n=1 Tax=Candidatus Thiomargarita nelsonii TaxID=1003181 RepID=A0A0A6PAB3_9GAMM|nr:ATP-binding protein [Candidatus Thiomargarita nelsonii]
MKIKKLQLENFTQFTELKVEFPRDVTVFIGNNGAGKTSLLRALAILLTWLIARIEREKGNGSPILDSDIENDAKYSKITLEVCESDNRLFQWTLVKQRKGFKSEQSSELKNVTRLADSYRNRLTQDDNSSLPLIAYYPVERVVLDIPLKIKKHHSFDQLDGYDNALTQGVDFRRFFEWFREREDAENENNLQQIMKLIFEENIPKEQLQDKLPYDKQLTAVRNAIAAFMSGFSKLQVQRKPRLQMTVEKHGKILDVAQLSQGEKTLMALVGDIARRLAMMNPGLEKPLQGEGIVLIDEIELHLHPQWQRGIIQRLRDTFPNCQFLLTTHSPLVISDAKNVQCYILDEKQLTQIDDLYGLDANQVLLKVMDTDIRNPEVEKKITVLLNLIQESELYKAKTALSELEQELSADDLELAKARLLIKRLEVLRAKNN